MRLQSSYFLTVIFKNSCLKHQSLDTKQDWNRRSGEWETYTVVVGELLVGINSHQDGSGVCLENKKILHPLLVGSVQGTETLSGGDQSWLCCLKRTVPTDYIWGVKLNGVI